MLTVWNSQLEHLWNPTNSQTKARTITLIHPGILALQDLLLQAQVNIQRKKKDIQARTTPPLLWVEKHKGDLNSISTPQSTKEKDGLLSLSQVNWILQPTSLWRTRRPATDPRSKVALVPSKPESRKLIWSTLTKKVVHPTKVPKEDKEREMKVLHTEYPNLFWTHKGNSFLRAKGL